MPVLRVYSASAPLRAGLASVLLAWAATAAGGQPAPDPWAKPVRLALWGGTVDEAIREFSAQADILVTISRPLLERADFRRRRLYLLTDGAAQADAATARTALELLARALGCRYYLPEPDQAMLVAGYDWLRGDETPDMVLRIDPTHDWTLPGDDDRDARQRLFELARATPAMNHTHCNFRIHPVPIGDAGRAQLQLEAGMPPTQKRLLETALNLCSAPPPPLPRGTPAPDALPAPPIDRLAMLVDADYTNRSPREIIQDIALQTGLVVAFDHTAFEDAPPADIDRLSPGLVPARDALLALSSRLGLGGAYAAADGRIVWLTADTRGWRDAAASMSRELLWHALSSVLYDVNEVLPSADAAGVVPPGHDGDGLADRLRATVTPGVWTDPMTALVFNPRRRALVAIAPPDTHAALLRELNALADAVETAGRWADAAPTDTGTR